MNERRRSGVFVRSATFHLAAPINRRQVVMVVVVLSPGSIPRVTELPKGREERRRGLRSDPSSLLLPRRRIISPPLPRDKLPRGAAPSLLFSLPPSPSFSLSFLSPAPETDRPSDRSIRHSLRRHRWTVAAPDNNGARGREGEREGGRKRENCPISLYLNSALNPTGRTLSREIRRGMGNATRKGPDLGQSLRIRSLFRKLPSHRWGFPFVRLNIDGSEPFFLFLSFPSESEFSL